MAGIQKNHPIFHLSTMESVRESQELSLGKVLLQVNLIVVPLFLGHILTLLSFHILPLYSVLQSPLCSCHSQSPAPISLAVCFYVCIKNGFNGYLLSLGVACSTNPQKIIIQFYSSPSHHLLAFFEAAETSYRH